MPAETPEVIREMASAFHRNRRIAERGPDAADAADDTDDEDLVDDDSQDPDTEPTEPSAKKPA